MMAVQGWLCWPPGVGTAGNRPVVAHKWSSYEDPGLPRIPRPMGEDAVVGAIHRMIGASEITTGFNLRMKIKSCSADEAVHPVAAL